MIDSIFRIIIWFSRCVCCVVVAVVVVACLLQCVVVVGCCVFVALRKIVCESDEYNHNTARGSCQYLFRKNFKKFLKRYVYTVLARSYSGFIIYLKSRILTKIIGIIRLIFLRFFYHI